MGKENWPNVLEINLINNIKAMASRYHAREPQSKKLIDQIKHNLLSSQWSDPATWLATNMANESALLTLGLLFNRAEDVDSEDGIKELYLRLKYTSTPANMADSHISQQEANRDALLLDLQHLSPKVDPIKWMINNRLPLVTQLVLKHLSSTYSSHFAPRNYQEGSPTFTKGKGKKYTGLNRKLSVTLKELITYEHWFIAHFTIWFKHPKNFPKFDLYNQWTLWEGFDALVDNRGTRYFLQRSEYDIHRKPFGFGFDQNLSMIGSPAPHPTDILTFQAKPTTITIYKPPQATSTIAQVPTPPMGHIEYVYDMNKIG